MKQEKTITLKTLSKSSVWDIQENDVFRLWEAAEKDNDLKDNQRRYLDIIRSAFEVEQVKVDRTEVLDKLIERGFKIGTLRIDDKNEKFAIKKRPIMRVTDLTYENIGHITASKLIEVLERNFGGGWDSLSQSIKDIIESGFDISTTTLPKDRLKKPGGLYEKKLADDYEVLVVPKGTWVEAIFAKEKPKQEKIRMRFMDEDELDRNDDLLDPDEDDDEDAPEIEDHYNDPDEDDDAFDDDKLTEESYRTTFEDPENLGLDDAEDVAADHYKLDNLCFIIDNNDLQIDGRVGEVSSPYPIDEKFRAFGFEVFCCDGHDFAALEETFQKVLNVTGKPAAIIAKTIKGNGVSYMEDQVGWHGKAPNDAEYEQGMKELEEVR